MQVSRIAAAALLLALAAALAAMIRRLRSRAWSARTLATLTFVVGLTLAGMVISDWPTDTLNSFWADHSVLAAVISTVLLAAFAFLAFEVREETVQAELSQNVSVAGVSGIIDHLADVDLALEMVQQNAVPDLYTSEGRPLRWLRPLRNDLQQQAQQSGTIARPDLDLADGQPANPDDLLDQCVRRIVAGMRDWASLLTVSADGRQVLVRLGTIRTLLMRLMASEIHRAESLADLRQYVQTLAYGLEAASSVYVRRRGLVTSQLDSSTRPSAISDDATAQLDGAPTLRVALEVADRFTPQP